MARTLALALALGLVGCHPAQAEPALDFSSMFSLQGDDGRYAMHLGAQRFFSWAEVAALPGVREWAEKGILGDRLALAAFASEVTFGDDENVKVLVPDHIAGHRLMQDLKRTGFSGTHAGEPLSSPVVRGKELVFFVWDRRPGIATKGDLTRKVTASFVAPFTLRADPPEKPPAKK